MLEGFSGLADFKCVTIQRVVSNIFRGEFVVNDFACGLSSEPSFNALILYWLLRKSERVYIFFVWSSFSL